MADLQVCYFCGSGPDSSLGEYAVVPPALDPGDDHQQSVVLCPDCREKLMTVMDPVVDAAEAYAADVDRAGGSAGDGDASSGGSGGADAPPVQAGADDAADAADATGTDDAADSGGSDGVADADTGDDGEADATGEADVTGDEDATDDGEEDDEADDAIPPDSNAKRDQPHADDELVGRNNEAYNKTLRLLQNRDFPVERHEIEQVAANAYQLDPQEVSDAIDALIRKGLLSQEGAQLVRP